MRRFVLRILGYALVAVGVVVTPLPLPFGLLMIAIGLVLLVANSEWAAGKVRDARQRWPGGSWPKGSGRTGPRSR